MHQSRRLDLHQHDAVYRTAASLFGHVGFLVPMPRYVTLPACSAARRDNGISTIKGRSARIRTPLGGFGDRFLSQEHTPVSAPGQATGGSWRNNYSRSVTFQYASLMNFDQLAIRTSWSA